MGNALHSSESSEYYSPPEIVEACRRVLGGIDLDPASCDAANAIVKARAIYTGKPWDGRLFEIPCGSVEIMKAALDPRDPGSLTILDGLALPWFGRVFHNPPYTVKGGGPAELWVDKLIAEYSIGNVQQAIALLNATPDRQWFRKLWAYTICFLDQRVDFIEPIELRRARDLAKNPPKVREYKPEPNHPTLTRIGSPTHGNVLVYFGADDRAFVREFEQSGVIIPGGSRVQTTGSDELELRFY